MDLGAFANIGDLEQLAKDNGIEVPRLRGYRLMAEEEHVDWKQVAKAAAVDIVEDLCASEPFWNPKSRVYCYNKQTDRARAQCVIMSPKRPGCCQERKGIRWSVIHGKKRKILKTAIHNASMKYRKQYEVWNKYVGRKDILYIHSRIGGNNWKTYHSMVDQQPWFLEKIDDAFDCTYCDIYAKINVGGQSNE